MNSESYFYLESEMIINFLNLTEGDEGDELRWLFALKGIDSFLNSFNLSEEKKLYLLENLKTAFGEEFGMCRSLKKQLNVKYGKERKRIESFLSLHTNTSKYDPIIVLLKQNELKTAKIVDEIMKLDKKDLLDVPLENLLYSHIHMFMNRLFRSKNRMHEMVIYDFLYRFYNSICARKRKNAEMAN